jgi:polysaccharide export outer membrane protein
MRSIVVSIIVIVFFHSIAIGGDYVIGEGDTLGISVWGVNELSLAVKVRPDGKITIPALGEVTAAGLTPQQLNKKLTKGLRKIVKKPVVTVSVEEINNNKVFIFGGGVESDVFNLERRTSLLQLLCSIEEFHSPDLANAYVLRKNKKIKENFYHLFLEGAINEDLLIKPDDVIFIPSFRDNNIYVVGAVNTPRFIDYREGLTMMEAILEAGGFTRFAKKNGAVIFRRKENEDIKIRVKLKDLIEEGDFSQNVILKPGDYIFVKEGIF